MGGVNSISNLHKRLDKIIPKIREDKFLEGRGLGNEISFYVFDYPPEHELVVRDYIEHIKKEFSHEGSNRRIIEIDLYKTMIELAKEKRIFERIFQIEEKQGKEALFKAMVNFAKPEVFLQKIKEKVDDHNVVLITGVGKVYPFVRSHNILNNLQEVLDKIPVIMFFPGTYDGLSLKLFNRLKDDNYYRAFRFVD
jgi:hemoglobin-like flavoprotein